MQTLHGYNLDETQWRVGKGGQYNYATKDGKEYFIKRLTFPRYPVSDNFKGEFKQNKIDLCNEWLRHRQEIMDAIPGSGTGTIAKPIEIFREGPCYYEVSYMIDTTSIPFEELYKESVDDKRRIMLTVAMSLSDLHKKGIIHGDLTPENILIFRLPGRRNVVKIIGFEYAFFESEPPKSISSEVEYQSPEVILYNQAAASDISSNPYLKDISGKIDVYSLGLIFYRYCVGKLPIPETNSSGQKVYGEKSLMTDQAIEPEFRKIIAGMLHNDPTKRPSMIGVQRMLLDLIPNDRLKIKGTLGPQINEKKNLFGDEEVPVTVVPGHGVQKAYIHPRNSRKVVLTFENGQNQILDKDLAMWKGYVK